jgi:hypothetical protein
VTGVPTALLRTPAITPGAASGPGLGLPARSEIEAWIDTINDLSSSATTYRAAAERVESAADAHVQQMSAPGGTVWEGDAADTARESSYVDRGVVYHAADQMRGLAKIASLGAQNLAQARDRALDAISDAESDGFQVGNDLTVTDSRRYTSRELSLYEERKTKAEEHHSYITMRARALASEDAAVGTKLHTGAAHLTGSIPLGWGNEHAPGQPVSGGDGDVQPLDNDGDGDGDHTYTGREIAEELEKLRDGKRTGIKEVGTEDEIFDLWEKYSQGGVQVPLPEDVADKIYDRVLLPDGTTVGIRESDPHGPTLDVGYPPGVDGPKKVHDPETPPPPPILPSPPPPTGGEAPIIAPPPNLPIIDHPPVGVPPVATPPAPGLLPPWSRGADVPTLSPPDLPHTDDPILAGIGSVVAGIGGFLAILANPRAALGG